MKSTEEDEPMKPPKQKEVGVGRVAFKARFDAIKEMVDAGYTTAAIHRRYGSQLGIGYTQLNNYINKFIKDKQTASKEKETQDGNRNDETRNTPAAPPGTTEGNKGEGNKKPSIAETFRSTDDLDDFLS